MKISLITYPGHADSAKIQEQNQLSSYKNSREWLIRNIEG